MRESINIKERRIKMEKRGAITTEARQYQTIEQKEKLFNTTCRIEDASTLLYDRLSHIVRQEPITENSLNENPEDLVPFAAELSTLNDRLCITADRLAYLIDNLEI